MKAHHWVRVIIAALVLLGVYFRVTSGLPESSPNPDDRRPAISRNLKETARHSQRVHSEQLVEVEWTTSKEIFLDQNASLHDRSKQILSTLLQEADEEAKMIVSPSQKKEMKLSDEQLDEMYQEVLDSVEGSSLNDDEIVILDDKPLGEPEAENTQLQYIDIMTLFIE